MSHIAKIEVEIKDLEALKAACTRIGASLVEGQKTYRWYGRLVGESDRGLPQGFTNDDLGRCDHAIKVPGADYEVGVSKRRDGKAGFVLLWDSWGSGGLERGLGAGAGKLVQAYGVEVAARAGRRAGYNVVETKRADGSIVIQLQGGRRW